MAHIVRNPVSQIKTEIESGVSPQFHHKTGRGNVSIARNSIPKPHKRQNQAILTCLFSAPISHYPLLITHLSLPISPNTAIKFPLFLGSRPRCFSRNHGEAGGVQPRRSGRYRTPQTSAVGIPFGLKRQRRLISASRGRRSLARRNSSAKPTA
jgi:hypothetical protein